ncbi:adhesion G-protein coupled receptor G5-like isoform X2 [Sphaeramia orbicularis]|uniref:adhesion G-protein coupled receptor G5-like isoform X2 n=1 Tax=Sphaeramia orbicularis TaxID=375764 RepID=UPI001180CAC4|nr:adhesion G-protein coupled receptor G5-like isoform X2 [Sphaeramia orbicularis]
MTANRWIVLAGLVGLLWICPIFGRLQTDTLRKCLKNDEKIFFVADNYNGVVNKSLWEQNGNEDVCIIFLDKSSHTTDRTGHKLWPQMKNYSNSLLLVISKVHINMQIQMYVLYGENCTDRLGSVSTASSDSCKFQLAVTDSCQIRCFNTKTVCGNSKYKKERCSEEAPQAQDNYIINVTRTEEGCINCNNPKKPPEQTIDGNNEEVKKKLNGIINTNNGTSLAPGAAVKVMGVAADLAASINGSTAALNLAEGISGILARETEPTAVDTVSFGYSSLNEDINVIDDAGYLQDFTRAVTIPKQAFETALSLNVSIAFVVVMRFTNMSEDGSNHTVLGNHVLGVEMGAEIKNLTETISITFANLSYSGIPSCHSWNGEGNLPNWTDYGCETVVNGSNITCHCSHLTFFAILLAPLNETVSSSDLNSLTIITQVGCGLSMFFLSIILFMHFFLRKAKANTATIILIHLVFALFFLNFTFLINNIVAQMESAVGCKIMAAVMHYFMLATFTWFAVQAFHLCLQLYTRGKIEIHRYVLKVSIISWVLPSIVGIILLSIGKYGEQVINMENTENNVAMCWITDSDVHYIVNIGYYVVVFLFTFSTFVILMSWVVCLKRSKTAGNAQVNKSGISMMTVLGLCCMLGVTWGFAFFAHGVFRVPAYYIFTILNSFQGFFLFIYYTNTSRSAEMNTGVKNFQSTSSTTTLKTILETYENPYENK